MDANTPIRFEIFAGHQIVRTEILMGASLKIGKLSSHSLKLDDPSVSRLHAELEVRNPNEVILKDLGSDQGTFLNNEPVMRAKLFTGDRVRFGDVECIVSVAGQTVRRPGSQASQPSQTQAVAQSHLVNRNSLPDFNNEVDRGYGKILQVLGLFDTAVIAYGHIHESEPGEFTIGFGVDADCVINQGILNSIEPFPLAEVTESGAMLVHVPDHINGEVMLDGKIFDLNGLRSAGRMTRG
jgi:pSer/pThr/pTyr-binding forkhead associated (FHA) protein